MPCCTEISSGCCAPFLPPVFCFFLVSLLLVDRRRLTLWLSVYDCYACPSELEITTSQTPSKRLSQPKKSASASSSRSRLPLKEKIPRLPSSTKRNMLRTFLPSLPPLSFFSFAHLFQRVSTGTDSANSYMFIRLCFVLGWVLADSLLIEYRISKRVAKQFQAFMSGFNELIPQELINVFDERELEVRPHLFFSALSSPFLELSVVLLTRGTRHFAGFTLCCVHACVAADWRNGRRRRRRLEEAHRLHRL
jgi:hypothetical protein